MQMAELIAEEGEVHGSDESDDESDDESEGDDEEEEHSGTILRTKQRSAAKNGAVKQVAAGGRQQEDEGDDDADPSTRAKAVTVARQQKEKIEREKQKQKLNGAKQATAGVLLHLHCDIAQLRSRDLWDGGEWLILVLRSVSVSAHQWVVAAWLLRNTAD